MKKIGVLFGVENSFPSALVERINARNSPGIQAEFVETGAVHLEQSPRYAVILDRISHDIPFYRAFLKHAALSGTAVFNNPFWCSADDKFLNYALAARLGVAVPATVLLPHKEYPNGTSEKSLRNLEFPLDWDSVLAAVGEHGFLKPIHGGGWRDVHEFRGRDEFFRAYDRSRDLSMVAQKAVEFTEYFRCFVIGQKKVRIMPYDPRRPHVERYLQGAARSRSLRARLLYRRMEEDALKLCRALGYDFNTVEFAVENETPYAIDFMNPVPDADVHSVGEANFQWIVEQVADFLIVRARAPKTQPLRWPNLPDPASKRPRVVKRRGQAGSALTPSPEK
jgi:glutathione synthase/RimK-type ligase-like ATP-grasp enzyme